MTPTRTQLRAIMTELRNAHTRLLPMEIAEQVQHTIVQIETLLVSPTIDPVAIDGAYETAQRLLRECERLTGKK